MSNFVTIQIQLDNLDKDIPDKHVVECEAIMYEACSKIEKFGYVRAEIFKNNTKWINRNI